MFAELLTLAFQLSLFGAAAGVAAKMAQEELAERQHSVGGKRIVAPSERKIRWRTGAKVGTHGRGVRARKPGMHRRAA
jgi:hypothetical protein